MATAVPVQLALFPVDDEERVLLSQGRLYAALPEDARRLVRAYLVMLREGNGCRQADWIRASGMPASTAHDALKRHEAQLWPAIQEACQLLGVRGAQFGAMALPVAGQIILRDLLQGRRSTSSLTTVELGILRECAAMVGLRPVGLSAGVSVSTPDGTTVTAIAGEAGLSQEDLAERLRSLRGRLVRTAAAGSEAAGPDSLRGGSGAALEASAGGQEDLGDAAAGEALEDGTGAARGTDGGAEGLEAGDKGRGAEGLEADGRAAPAAVPETADEGLLSTDAGRRTAGNGRHGSTMVAAALAALVALAATAMPGRGADRPGEAGAAEARRSGERQATAAGAAARVNLGGWRGVGGPGAARAIGVPYIYSSRRILSGKISRENLHGSVPSGPVNPTLPPLFPAPVPGGADPCTFAAVSPVRDEWLPMDTRPARRHPFTGCHERRGAKARMDASAVLYVGSMARYLKAGRG